MSTFSTLFERQVEQTPDTPALLDDDGETTYDQLNAQANRLARILVRRGFGPDDIIAVSLPKGRELIVVLLAVMKSGAAYLPLDPAYPVERIHHMLSDARPVLFVTSQDSRIVVPDGLPVLHLDTPATQADLETASPANVRDAERIQPLRDEHLIYIIYTSGSTGMPKGVAVSHTGLDDLVRAQRDFLDTGPGHRVLQWASMSFDAAFWDISISLLSGATLVVVDQQHLFPGPLLTDTLRRYRVTHAVLPPVALTAIDAHLPDLIAVMSTGDTCTQALVSRWSQGRRMYNGYGPTETTVGATIAGPLRANARATIGRAWSGSEVLVLDEEMHRLPDGECGEIYIASTGLARGYLGQPGLTATRFVANPFGLPGSRLYRTGDLGYVDEDGELVFAGRNDQQVKLRGYRVELGEVEAALSDVPGITIAVVTVHGDGLDARLIGHIVQTDPIEPDVILKTLGKRLPAHMLPDRLVVHDRLPTTPNGKIDRSKLTVVPQEELALRSSSVAVTDPEQGALPALSRIVCEILGRDVVEPSGNFFRYGGNSILSTHLVRSVSKELGVPLTVRAVFEAPDLRSLAKVIDALADRCGGG
ncbi:non-ribosomal peptide synthetase [Actinomyces sp. Marseille-P3109]|uniref:non-ribosomal peptide synthetase n=1 Tax=Actinomyces sp. Marseille-P3109 TaxID=2083009 RepID=UPI000D560419|nr:non-ribosomal peptide synthetase [Actinomyces sp. Marseille-P3109]